MNTTIAPAVAITITINQKPHEMAKGATVADALVAMAAKPPFAVAVNTVFVPGSQHAQHLLCAGDRVEVISPVTGG